MHGWANRHVVTTSTGFELRGSTDGAVLSQLTLPASSQAYDARVFSPDKELVALSIFESGRVRIELWRIADGALLRTIPTDANTRVRALDFSTSGLLATMQRFAYQQGGFLRVFRLSDGALVHQEGPLVRNSSTRVKFSPDAQYLAIHDHNAGGVRVLATADWSIALVIGEFAAIFDWYPDSSSLWVASGAGTQIPAFDLVAVPGGNKLLSVPWEPADLAATAVTPDGRFFLASQPVTTDPNSPPGDTLAFSSAADSATAVTFKSGPVVSAGTINPNGTQFTYTICPPEAGTCTFYVAQMPAL